MAPRWLGVLARKRQVKWPFPGCATCRPSSNSAEATSDRSHLIYTQEHFALRASLRKIIDKEINPFVDKWEEEGQFPAHQVFKTLGKAGFLGVNKPTGCHPGRNRVFCLVLVAHWNACWLLYSYWGILFSLLLRKQRFSLIPALHNIILFIQIGLASCASQKMRS